MNISIRLCPSTCTFKIHRHAEQALTKALKSVRSLTWMPINGRFASEDRGTRQQPRLSDSIGSFSASPNTSLAVEFTIYRLKDTGDRNSRI